MALYTAPGAGTQLTWFDRAGKPLGAVGSPGVFIQPAISPDGSTVAVDRIDSCRSLLGTAVCDHSHMEDQGCLPDRAEQERLGRR